MLNKKMKKKKKNILKSFYNVSVASGMIQNCKQFFGIEFNQ